MQAVVEVGSFAFYMHSRRRRRIYDSGIKGAKIEIVRGNGINRFNVFLRKKKNLIRNFSLIMFQRLRAALIPILIKNMKNKFITPLDSLGLSEFKFKLIFYRKLGANCWTKYGLSFQYT